MHLKNIKQMKKYIYIAILTIVLSLVGSTVTYYRNAAKYKELYNISLNNERAYNHSEKHDPSKSLLFRQTIDDLKQSNDSLIQELLLVKKEKRIKDKNLQEVSYQVATTTKTDTINFVDTIFVNEVNIDTTLTDKWYKLNLSLRYPTTFVVTPTFNSERYVLISTKKVYNNKPSKVFFIRWFQKKHTEISVDVEEKNPYITINKQKYIKVIK